MPIWLIEVFGTDDLDRTFVFLNLTVGTMMNQKTIRSGMRAPVELLLCWWVGAVALLPFAARLLLRKRSPG